MKKQKNSVQNFKKDFIWNTVGSTINAFNSLFFMIMATRINGVKDAGIFTFAFSTATLFYIIGIYSGRVYQVTDATKTSDKDYFVNKILTCIAMMAVSIAFILIKGYSFQKTIIIFTLCILKMVEAFVEIFYAYFQKDYQLYYVGISLVLKNILSLFVFFVVDSITKNIFISSCSLIISYLFIVFTYDIKKVNIKKRLNDKVNWKNVFSILTKGFFTFCLSFLTMYIINIPRYSIDSLMSDKYSTIFGILIMPASVMVLLAQFVLQPFIMSLKDCLEDNNIKKFSLIIIKIVSFIFVVGLFVLLCTYILGIPILEILYGINLAKYKNSLMIVMTGAVMYSIIVILSNILITMRVTFQQVVIYGINVIISLVLSYKLVKIYGIMGACLGYCIVMCSLLLWFLILICLSIIKRAKGVELNAKD